MADYKILFKGSNYCKKHSLECFGGNGDLWIAIYPDNKKTPVWITLDKSTAIKFIKRNQTSNFFIGGLIMAKDTFYFSHDYNE